MILTDYVVFSPPYDYFSVKCGSVILTLQGVVI